MPRLFVRFEYQTTERELRDLFSPYDMSEVLICRGRGGASKGFGFITCENPESAIADLNGTTYRDWPLLVEVAQERSRDPRRRAAAAD